MKRTLTALVAFTLVAAACGSDETNSTASPETTPSTVATNATPVATAAPEQPVAETAPTTEPVQEPTTTLESTTTTEAIQQPLETLRILHPETLGFAAPFTMIDPAGPLSEVTENVELDVWLTADVMRSAVVNGDADVTAVPTYVGSNLYNKGVDIQMLAVVVWGLLWMVGPDGTAPSWDELRGQTVMIPFQNDMPDLVFQYLAKANGLVVGEDFTIEYYAQPPEIIGQLLSGAGQWAILPEHVATIAIAQGNLNGQSLGRVFDLQAEWASATGSSPRIPQAGVIVPGALASDRPDVMGALLDELALAVEIVNKAAPETIEALSTASGVPGPMIEQVIPRLNLEIVPAGEARPELERFFTELATLSPDIIGGNLPDADFYLDDPR